MLLCTRTMFRVQPTFPQDGPRPRFAVEKKKHDFEARVEQWLTSVADPEQRLRTCVNCGDGSTKWTTHQKFIGA